MRRGGVGDDGSAVIRGNHWQQIARARACHSKMRLFKRRSSDPIDPQLTGLRFGEVRIRGGRRALIMGEYQRIAGFETGRQLCLYTLFVRSKESKT